MTHPSLQQQLFSTTWDLYTDLRQLYVKHNTVLTLLDTRRSFLQYLPDRPISEYTDIDLLQFTRACVAAGRRPGGVNIDLRNLRAFGHWLGKKKLLDRDNVFSEVEVLPVEAKQIRFLSHEEFRRIYQAETSELLRRIYLVCLLTGQRIGDVLKLQWQDIDLDRSMIRATNQKANRLSRLPINPTLHQVLRDMRPDGASGAVFEGRNRAKLTVGYVSHKFKLAARRAGIHDVSLHTLRKTFGSWLALSGIDLRSIQSLLGHSSIAVTEKYYAALCTSNLHGVVAMIQPVTGSLPNLISGPGPDSRFQVQHSVKTLKM